MRPAWGPPLGRRPRTVFGRRAAGTKTYACASCHATRNPRRVGKWSTATAAFGLAPPRPRTLRKRSGTHMKQRWLHVVRPSHKPPFSSPRKRAARPFNRRPTLAGSLAAFVLRQPAGRSLLPQLALHQMCFSSAATQDVHLPAAGVRFHGGGRGAPSGGRPPPFVSLVSSAPQMASAAAARAASDAPTRRLPSPTLKHFVLHAAATDMLTRSHATAVDSRSQGVSLTGLPLADGSSHARPACD